ncbi:hypothetical protein Ciccas_000979 [Cichlidogyrus casuarinus]|uniref:Uncharacterized protein n=1 Tax=Cichlidogyrus casuarinus TaxID=1844966 RepID=A0ABD2QLD1_9PLAT
MDIHLCNWSETIQVSWSRSACELKPLSLDQDSWTGASDLGIPDCSYFDLKIESHAKFEELCGQALAEHREEDRMCSQLMRQSHMDGEELVQQLFYKLERKKRILKYRSLLPNDGLTTKTTADPSNIGKCQSSGSFDYEERPEFFRLDSWEDDSRRRRRLVPNPIGSSHLDSLYQCLNGTTSPRGSKNEAQKLKEVIRAAKPDPENTSLSSHEDSNQAKNGDEEIPSPACSSPRPSIESASLSEGNTIEESAHKNAIVASYVGYSNRLPDDTPVVYSTDCHLISTGLRVLGYLTITRAELCFDWYEEHSDNKALDPKLLAYVEHLHARWAFPEIRAIFTRRHLHRLTALEIFMSTRNAVLLAFSSTEVMQETLRFLPAVGIGMKYNIAQSRKSSVATPRQLFQHSAMTHKWQQREMSNFDYLMYLNTIAGRSYNDLNQYPIFPWVLSDYSSQKLDLASMASYRDLSKPIGALNEKRKQFFDRRFQEWDDDSQQPFHYGTHYSTAAFVLSYLIRLEPFTTAFLNLQSGKFDNPNRLFHSVARTWDNCQISSSDVKELIPEFFYLPEMFRNDNRYQMGVTDDQIRVDDVVLPPWASTPEEFVTLHRQALESEFVSCQLHHWIDLIFGYKQRGVEAVKATNVFCYLTYEDSIDFSKITDPTIQEALKNQIQCFGQTPSQLLTTPHPPRNSNLHISPQMFRPLKRELCMVLKCPSNSPLVHLECNTLPTNRFTNSQSSLSSSIVTVSQNLLFGLHRWSLVVASMMQAQNPEEKANSDHQNHDTPLLPLTLDQNLTNTTGLAKRFLGDAFALDEQRLGPEDACHFVVSPDNRSLLVCGYLDNSVRVYSLETGRLLQIVRGGHSAPVCCLTRSECSGGGANFYLATGGRDSLVMLWPFDLNAQLVLSEFTNEPPVPHAILEGHVSYITCIAVSTELGIVFSGAADGVLLLHTIRGDLLRRLDVLVLRELAYRGCEEKEQLRPQRLLYSREGHAVALFSRHLLAVYTLNGRLLRCASVSNIIPNLEMVSEAGDGFAISKEVKINSLAMSRCGFYLICGDSNGFAWCIRSLTFERMHLFPRCIAPIRSLDLTNDQKYLVLGLESGAIVVLHIDFNQWHPEYQKRYKSLDSHPAPDTVQ